MRQLFLAATLATLGLLAWWLQPDEEVRRDARQTAGRQPDYTVDHLAVTTMGATGSPSRRLVARELRHYPDEMINELEEPRLTLFKEGGPPWLIRSDLGQISEDGDEILLKGPVFIDRAVGETNQEVHIKTWELQVRTREQYARTEQPVHLTSGVDWLSSASGAKVWFGDQLHVSLFGRARLQFDVP